MSGTKGPDARPSRMRPLTIVKTILALAIGGFVAMLLYGYARNHPEDMPWTPLDLGQPIGAFTAAKLANLGDKPGRCHALLARAGADFTALPPRSQGPQCGYAEAVRLGDTGSAVIAYRPAGLGTSCPVAAGLALWEWHVVQPAALARFGSRIVRIDHFGSYNCRRVYGRAEGIWSEHATANAVDIAAFRLADGRRIAVATDWNGPDAGKRAFLREVRSGACRLFSTVLSPDYNAAHNDHLHLDEAKRGGFGWRACR